VSYYRGDYYRGDPGFFSFLGGLAKTAVGFIPGVGPIASKAIDVASSALTKRATAAPIATLGEIKSGIRPVLSKAGAVIRKHPVLSAAGAAGTIGAAAGVAHHLMRGKHGGGGGRRMNVCNPRALRRAIRRTHAFARLAMKTIHLVHPKKKARFGGFKRRKKARC
jgi:hypothetical protein